MPGMPGKFSTPPRVSDPDTHHSMCVTYVPWCMSRWLTSVFLWSQWRGKRSRHSWRIRNPQLYVSDKGPMGFSVHWLSKNVMYSIANDIYKIRDNRLINLQYRIIDRCLITVNPRVFAIWHLILQSINFLIYSNGAQWEDMQAHEIYYTSTLCLWLHKWYWQNVSYMTHSHYTDLIMDAMASQITSLTIVYSTINSGADQRKQQSSASLAFVRGIHRLNLRTNGQ